MDLVKNDEDSQNNVRIHIKKSSIKEVHEIDWFVFSILNNIIQSKYNSMITVAHQEYSSKAMGVVIEKIREKFNDSTLTHGNMFINTNNQLMNNRV